MSCFQKRQAPLGAGGVKGKVENIMKMAVIYHSVTNNTKNMGEQIVKGMNSVEGVDAKSFPIEAVDVEFVKEAKCVVFGSPIYAAHITEIGRAHV